MLLQWLAGTLERPFLRFLAVFWLFRDAKIAIKVGSAKDYLASCYALARPFRPLSKKSPTRQR